MLVTRLNEKHRFCLIGNSPIDPYNLIVVHSNPNLISKPGLSELVRAPLWRREFSRFPNSTVHTINCSYEHFRMSVHVIKNPFYLQRRKRRGQCISNNSIKQIRHHFEYTFSSLRAWMALMYFQTLFRAVFSVQSCIPDNSCFVGYFFRKRNAVKSWVGLGSLIRYAPRSGLWMSMKISCNVLGHA